MIRFNYDLNNTNGAIKPLNAVNNGPINKNVRGETNFFTYQDANIPFARLHDSSFNSDYGGEFTVDVHRIFRNFDADVESESSYDFGETDNYLKTIDEVGTKIYYRLGAQIEHHKKFGTYPPKDFTKWAKICEHIILHYTEGWANGYHYDIEYWEIWNEPDCRNADGSCPCWQGTEDQFIEFYNTASKYLKSKFPNLKIGGPAFCCADDTPFKKRFLQNVAENNIPLDFFSYHCYTKSVQEFADIMKLNRKLLDDVGLTNVPTILNEWNYVRGWLGEDWMYTIRNEKGLKGASFITSVMCAGQANPVDILMYYDARPCCMNGLFNTDFLNPLKGYYSIKGFGELLRLGTCVTGEYNQDTIYGCCATNGNEHAILLSNFSDDDSLQSKTVQLVLSNVGDKKIAQVYVTNGKFDEKLVKKIKLNKDGKLTIKIDAFATVLVKIC